MANQLRAAKAHNGVGLRMASSQPWRVKTNLEHRGHALGRAQSGAPDADGACSGAFARG